MGILKYLAYNAWILVQIGTFVKSRQVKFRKMASQFGQRIKGLRKSQKMLQRQVASLLDIDSPMLSKLERGERTAKKKQVYLLAKTLGADPDELLTLWLADQVVDMVKDEENGLKAMLVAEEQIKYSKIKT